jgi:hypothetical protein
VEGVYLGLCLSVGFGVGGVELSVGGRRGQRLSQLQDEIQ